MSDSAISPSRFRTSTPKAPCSTLVVLCQPLSGVPPKPCSCWHSQVKYQPSVLGFFGSFRSKTWNPSS